MNILHYIIRLIGRRRSYMSIKNYYYKLGDKSLNISLYFIFVSAIIGLLFSNRPKLLVASFLLLYFSILYYFIHLYFMKRSYRTGLKKNSADYCPSGLEVYLIEKAEPFMHFFQPDGIANINLRFKHTWKGLHFIYDENGQKIIVQVRKEKNGLLTYELKVNNETIIGNIWLDKKNGELILPKCTIQMRKIMSGDIVFYQDYMQLACRKKGWLPLNWTSTFRLNTPVLTFQEKLTSTEKMAIFLAIACVEG